MQNVSDKVPTNKNNVFEDISTNSHRADTFRKNKLQIELQQLPREGTPSFLLLGYSSKIPPCEKKRKDIFKLNIDPPIYFPPNHIDMNELAEFRKRIPCLKERVPDAYFR